MKTAEEWIGSTIYSSVATFDVRHIRAIQVDALEAAAKIADDYAADDIRECCAGTIAKVIRGMKP